MSIIEVDHFTHLIFLFEDCLYVQWVWYSPALKNSHTSSLFSSVKTDLSTLPQPELRHRAPRHQLRVHSKPMSIGAMMPSTTSLILSQHQNISIVSSSSEGFQLQLSSSLLSLQDIVALPAPAFKASIVNNGLQQTRLASHHWKKALTYN